MYIKVLNSRGDLVRVEEIESPGYVRFDKIHKCLLRCKKELAEGILSADCSVTYNYNADIGMELTASLISPAEYDTLQVERFDPEDEAPEIPEETPETEDPPLTRAQLTAKVVELEAQNNMLLECLLEMSEAVYA